MSPVPVLLDFGYHPCQHPPPGPFGTDQLVFAGRKPRWYHCKPGEQTATIPRDRLEDFIVGQGLQDGSTCVREHQPAQNPGASPVSKRMGMNQASGELRCCYGVARPPSTAARRRGGGAAAGQAHAAEDVGSDRGHGADCEGNRAGAGGGEDGGAASGDDLAGGSDGGSDDEGRSNENGDRGGAACAAPWTAARHLHGASAGAGDGVSACGSQACSGHPLL